MKIEILKIDGIEGIVLFYINGGLEVTGHLRDVGELSFRSHQISDLGLETEFYEITPVEFDVLKIICHKFEGLYSLDNWDTSSVLGESGDFNVILERFKKVLI